MYVCIGMEIFRRNKGVGKREENIKVILLNNWGRMDLWIFMICGDSLEVLYYLFERKEV